MSAKPVRAPENHDRQANNTKIASGKMSRMPLSIPFFGLTGFEPATPSPPDLYAKPLRYSPESNDILAVFSTLNQGILDAK